VGGALRADLNVQLKIGRRLAADARLHEPAALAASLAAVQPVAAQA
jgi:hypothetical protein